MIVYIYGAYQTAVDSYRPKGIKCFNCNSSNQIVVEKLFKVFHLMYIPIFSNRSNNIFTCKSCNNEFNLRDLDIDSKKYYEQYKSRKRTPLWLFSGPILILIALGWFGYSQISKENEMLNRLSNGNQSQIIEYETYNGKYTSLKTLRITSDSIWLNYNEFEIENYDYIDRITDSNNYSSDTTQISMQYLTELIEKGNVMAMYPSR